MSNNPHSHPLQTSLSNAQAMLTRVDSELTQGYVEVEIQGVSFRRLACIYVVGARELKLRALNGMRSLLRLHPAH